MGFFSELFNGIASSIRTVVHVATDVAATAATVIKTKYRLVKEKYANLNIERLKQTRFDELKSVNDEIIEIERKSRRDGRLTEDDSQRLEELIGKRSKLRERIENAKEVLAAEDIIDHESDYAHKSVDPENPNELVRLGGQVMLNKPCPFCSRPQAIRWPTNVREPTVNDLFWACTGYFIFSSNGERACQYKHTLGLHDREIFANIARPGLELPANRLNNIILKPEVSQLIKNKLSDSVREASENYLCPVHHEPMELRTKNAATDLLDLYYLKCRRCDQIVKVKSACQLDAVLQSYDQKGLF